LIWHQIVFLPNNVSVYANDYHRCECCDIIYRRYQNQKSCGETEMLNFKAKKDFTSVNYITSIFLMWLVCTVYLYLQFLLVLYWQKEIGKKLLVKCWWNWLQRDNVGDTDEGQTNSKFNERDLGHINQRCNSYNFSQWNDGT